LGTIEASVRSAGFDGRFKAVLSADAARVYKPLSAVNQLALERFGLAPNRVGFVSANGWDATGAAAHGFAVAWLRAPGQFSQRSRRRCPEASWATVRRQFDPALAPTLDTSDTSVAARDHAR
jgi:FMN phosphatase YigB (HAD superfamily)